MGNSKKTKAKDATQIHPKSIERLTYITLALLMENDNFNSHQRNNPDKAAYNTRQLFLQKDNHVGNAVVRPICSDVTSPQVESGAPSESGRTGTQLCLVTNFLQEGN